MVLSSISTARWTKKRNFILRFEFLQRLNIVKLQLDLVRLKSRFQRERRASIQDLEAFESTLERYGERSFINES